MWNTLLYQPLLNGLVALYLLFGNMGWAIVVFTAVIRSLLLPLTLPALKASQKIKQLTPKLEKLKKKYQNDKQKLAQAQMDLYRSAGIKPMAGLLPQIIQIVILIALYQAFRNVLSGGEISKLNELLYQPFKLGEDITLNLQFAYLKLTEPDLVSLFGRKLPGIFIILAGVAQFLAAKLMIPQAKKEEKAAKKTESPADDFASAFQTQSLYLFPAMTILFGLRFPSGLVLYWLVFSLFNLVQQFFIKKQVKGGK